MAAWLGLMSGTSMDSVDAVLVSFRDGQVEMHGSHAQSYPTDLRQRLLLASQNQATPDDLGELDTRVGQLFASAAQAVIAKAGLAPEQIRAIGSHGQTLRHQPTGSAPFSLQIGNPAIIAEACGILTVADFRRRDVAAGGQGAPLVPAFHQAFFGSRSENRCILNLGGIANITWLPADVHATVFGFDTGPANALLDAWCQHQTGRAYDADGHWAAEGTVDEALLEDMLSDAYFDRPAPKSTGKERFNLDWLKTVLTRHPGLAPEDVQRTLLELTAQSIARQLPGAGGRYRVCLRWRHPESAADGGAGPSPGTRALGVHRGTGAGAGMGGTRGLCLAGQTGRGREARQFAGSDRGTRAENFGRPVPRLSRVSGFRWRRSSRSHRSTWRWGSGRRTGILAVPPGTRWSLQPNTDSSWSPPAA